MDAAFTSRGQLKVLTSLRFFAAALVVLFHVQATGTVVGGPWWYRNLASLGFVGVSCFFVLSGFILVYNYAGTPLDAKRFWRARFARVYPMYLFSLLVTAPIFLFAMHSLHSPVFAWSEQHLAAACILAIILMQAWLPGAAETWNPVCWSLSAEAFFYLLFPMLLASAKGLSKRGLVIGIVLCAVFSMTASALYVLVHPDGIDMINSTTPTLLWQNVLSFNPLLRAPEFITGVLTGYLFIEGKGNRQIAGRLVIASLCVLAILVIFADRIPRSLVSPGLLSPTFATLIFGLALRPGWVRFLEARWLVRLGEASYSLYLLHSIVILIGFNLFPGLPVSLRLCFALAAAIGVALLCFALIERPARKWLMPHRDRVHRSTDQTNVAAEAATNSPRSIIS